MKVVVEEIVAAPLEQVWKTWDDFGVKALNEKRGLRDNIIFSALERSYGYSG